MQSDTVVEEQPNANSTNRKRKQGDMDVTDSDSPRSSDNGLHCDASLGRVRKRKAITPSKWRLDSEPTNVLVNRPIATASGRQRQAIDQGQQPQQQLLQLPLQPQPHHGQEIQRHQVPNFSQVAVSTAGHSQLYQQPHKPKVQHITQPVVDCGDVPQSLDESVNAAMTMVSEEMTSPRAEPMTSPSVAPPQLSLAEYSGHLATAPSPAVLQPCGIPFVSPDASATAAAAVDSIKTESRWGIQSIVSDDEAASVLAAAAAAMLDESLSPR